MPVFVGPNNDDSRLKSDRVGFAVSTANPNSASTGDSYFNSADNQLKVYNGSDWDSVGSGGGTFEAVASGTLSDGSTIVINTDGTVSGVATVGAARTFNSSMTQFSESNETVELVEAAYDTTQDRIVIIYKATNTTARAVVGNVSGSTITFGTPVTFHNGSISYHDIAYHAASGKMVIAYRAGGDNDYCNLRVGTVDGSTNSISFGSETTYDQQACGWPRICYDSNQQRCVIAYSGAHSAYPGKAVVVDVTAGGTPSYGTIASFNGSNAVHGKDIIYDAASQKVVIYFKDGATNTAKAIVGTVADNGTDISFFQNPVEFESGTITSVSLRASYDSNAQKSVVVFVDSDDSDNGKARVGTVSGTGSDAQISFGNLQTFNAASTSQLSVGYDPDAQKTLIVYNTSGGESNSKLKEATISGTDISFSDIVYFAGSVNQQYPGMVYDPVEETMVIGVRSDTSPYIGGAFTYDASKISTNLTATNFIGFSDGAYTNGQTAKIQIVSSIVDAQVGLTTGSPHYVQIDGTLSTSADNPSVLAGTALSGTEIIVKS